MAKSINVKAVLSNLAPGSQPFYRLVPQGITTITKDQFVMLLADQLGLAPSEAQYTVDRVWSLIMKLLMENKRVELPYLSASLAITGSVKSMTDQPTKEKNPVVVRLLVKGDAADKINEVKVVNVTVSVEVSLQEVMQIGASAVSRIENENDITLNGKGLTINAAAEDEGIWLEKSGTLVKKAEMKSSSDNEARANFGSLGGIENGVYDLCVSTRAGKTAAEAPARVLRRKVTVAK